MPRFIRQRCVLCLVMFLSLGTLSAVFGEPPRDAAKSESNSKDKNELLVDVGRSVFILSDRKEKVAEFFQRNRVVVGAIWQKDLDKLIRAKEPIAKIFLDYTSANDDPEKAERYGDHLTLAPLPPAVADLIEKHATPREKDGDRSIVVVLCRDADNADLYRVVGMTTHTPVSFFATKEKLKGDDFAPADLKYKAAAKDDAKLIAGKWSIVSAELSGETYPAELTKTLTLILEKDKYILKSPGPDDSGTIAIDAGKTPKQIDVHGLDGLNKGHTFLGIYQLDGDSLKVCYDLAGKSRPREFKTAKGTKQFLVLYKRIRE